MVSRTRVTRNRRANKRTKLGRKRKNRLMRHGSTPKFDIHIDKK